MPATSTTIGYVKIKIPKGSFAATLQQFHGSFKSACCNIALRCLEVSSLWGRSSTGFTIDLTA